jgi:hypothetical protein
MLKTIECPKCHVRVTITAERLGAYYSCRDCGSSFDAEAAIVGLAEGSVSSPSGARPADPKVALADCINRSAYCLALSILALLTIPTIIVPWILGASALACHGSAKEVLGTTGMPASALAMSAIGYVFSISALIAASMCLLFYLIAA